MSAVWANTTFSWQDQVLQLGNQRDSADPVVVACPLLFTSVPPTAAQVTGVQYGYLSEYPGGPDDPSGA